MFEKILNFIGLEKKSVFDRADGASSGAGGLYSFGLGGKKLDVLMRQNSGWVYACVKAISQGISSIPFKLYKKGKAGTYEEVEDHELLDLLSFCNDYQTGNELKYLTASHLELTGNSFWLLEGVEKENDTPTAIYPFDPSKVEIIKGDYPELVKGYKIKVNETTTKILQPFQVIHIKYPDPSDPVLGLGTVQSALQWIDTDNYATELNRQYFINGARLSGIIESETNLSPEQMSVLKSSFEQVHKGAKNGYKVAVLPAGSKYNASSDSPKDMDFANLADKMRDRILAVFGVPKTVIGSAESETNRATAETANYVFAHRKLKPVMQLITDYLNEKLVSIYGDDLWLSFEDPTPEDRAAKMQEVTVALGMQPALSVNEARDKYFGTGPIENGDNVMTTFNQVPLGAPKAKSISIFSEKSFKGKAKKGFQKKAAKNMTAEITEGIAKSISSIFEKKDITKLTDLEFAPIHKEKIGRVTPYEKTFKAKLQGYNADIKKETLKRISGLMKNKAVAANDFFDKDEGLKVFIDLSEPIFIEMYGKEAKKALELIGVESFDVLTPEVRKALQRVLQLLGEGYNATTIDLLKSTFEVGLSEGVSLSEMKDKISAVFNYSDSVRAETVARTEMFRIANDAEREAWKQSGVVDSLLWFTAEDESVCEFCGPMNGKEVGIDENFYNKGDVVYGKDGGVLSLDYAPVSGGSLHPNCRCEIRPGKISEEKSIVEKDITDKDVEEIIKSL